MKKKSRDYLMFLEDIFESAEKIEKYTKGFTKKKLVKNQETQDAVIRRFARKGVRYPFVNKKK